MNINEVKGIIRAAALADDTVIIEGLHGIGKSEAAKQIMEEDDYHMETLFLSHQEVGDLIGTPHTIMDGDTAITTWSVPIWLDRMNNAAWPDEFEMSDLTFRDKDFEEFVKNSLS